MPNNLGLMEFKGISNSKSYYGLSIDYIKTNLISSLLKGDLDKSIWYTIELDIFYYLNNAINIRNLMINIIKNFCINYIGLKNPLILFDINNLINEWEKNKIDNYKESQKNLITLIKLIVKQKKDNSILLLNNIINNLKKNINLIEKDNIVYNKFIEDPTNKFIEDQANNNYVLGDLWLLRTEKDPDILVRYMDNFIYYFDKNDDNIFFWLFKILDLTKKKIKSERRYKRWKPIYAIWEHLIYRSKIEYTEKSNMYKLINILLEFYLKNDNISYILMSCLLLLKQPNLDNIYNSLETTSLEETEEFYNKHYEKLIQNDNSIIHCNNEYLSASLLDLQNILKINKKIKKKRIIVETQELMEDKIPGNILNIKENKSKQYEYIKEFMKNK